MKVAVGTAAVLALALLLYLTFGEYTRKVHVTGSIVPGTGVIRAVASQYGMVVARPVRGGDVVAQGQVLYELSSERTNGSGGIDARIDHSLIERRSLLAEERELQTAQLQQREKEIYQGGAVPKFGGASSERGPVLAHACCARPGGSRASGSKSYSSTCSGCRDGGGADRRTGPIRSGRNAARHRYSACEYARSAFAGPLERRRLY